MVYSIQKLCFDSGGVCSIARIWYMVSKCKDSRSRACTLVYLESRWRMIMGKFQSIMRYFGVEGLLVLGYLPFQVDLQSTQNDTLYLGIQAIIFGAL